MSRPAPLKFFLYREGEHFHVPAELGEAGLRPQRIPLLSALDETGNCPQGRFCFVSSPEDADYIVFPYVLEAFIRVLRAMWVHSFIRALPHFRNYERKHVFFHCHDLGHPLFTEALILTNAPDRFNTDDPFLATLPYAPGGHVLRHSPDFDFDAIDMDTNFVGTLSGHVRYDLARSIPKTQGLRFVLQHPSTLDWSSKSTSYLHMDDPAQRQALEAVFIQAMRRSWTTLCPRGNGSSSIRFYEAMCMGRIPVHISDAYRLPFEEAIDYSEFCLFIPEAEVHMAGSLLRMWLGKRDTAQLMAMCRKARQVWERYFRPEDEIAVCLEHMRAHLPHAKRQGPPRYRQESGPLAADGEARLVTPPGFYANMVADDQKLWVNTKPEEAPWPQEPQSSSVNGVRSALALKELLRVAELAGDVPENGTVVCSGAPSGALAIALANGLIQAKNFSSLVYGVEDWEHDSQLGGESRADFACNIRAARVQNLVRPVSTTNGPQAFRAGSVNLAVLDAIVPDSLQQTLTAWLTTLTPEGRIALVPADKRADCALAVRFARQNKLAPVIEPDQSLIVLSKAESSRNPADTRCRGCQPSPPRPAGGRAPAGGNGRGWSGQTRPPEKERFLVVKATGGLGNRLLGILCAVTYSLMTGRRLCVDWSDFMYSDRGENVFPKLFKLRGVPYTYRLPQAHDVYPEFWRELLQTNALIEQFNINHLDPAVMDVTRIDLAKHYPNAVTAFWSFNLDPLQAALGHIRTRLPQFAHLDVDGICREVMKQHLLPRSIVSDKVDAFAARHFSGPMVGVHVRHTDLRMPLEKTVQAVQDLQQTLGARIFLATDSQDIERSLSQRFGDALVAVPKKYPANGKHLHSHKVAGLSNFDKALDAAVEMYLLSRCDALVRYQPSTFAQISWYCSDVPAERMVCVQ